jgi:hypothetical protein
MKEGDEIYFEGMLKEKIEDKDRRNKIADVNDIIFGF